MKKLHRELNQPPTDGDFAFVVGYLHGCAENEAEKGKHDNAMSLKRVAEVLHNKESWKRLRE